VTPTENTSNLGSRFANAMNFKTAVGKSVAGDVILLQAGTYAITYTTGAKNNSLAN
jgi:hypothetical protein